MKKLVSDAKEKIMKIFETRAYSNISSKDRDDKQCNSKSDSKDIMICNGTD